MNATDVTKVMETVLSIPGMNETVKIDFKMSRKNILLLSNIIEHGLTGKQDQEGLLAPGSMPKEVVTELLAFASECLQKAGLTELNEKLKTFGSK